MSTAVAAKLITSEQIKDGTVKSVDLSDGVNAKLAQTGDEEVWALRVPTTSISVDQVDLDN